VQLAVVLCALFAGDRVLEHPADARHVEHVEVERAPAESIDACVAVSLAQAHELVALPHHRPWKRTAEQALREEPDVLAALFRASD
jgi:hypothetical protein